MGKMPLRGKQTGRGRYGNPVERNVEFRHLALREGKEKALEQDDRFAKAGIQVVMRSVERVPFAFRLHAGNVVQLLRGVGESVAEVLNEIQEGRDFMKKLRTLA